MRINLWVAAGLAAALLNCGRSGPADGGDDGPTEPNKADVADFFVKAEAAYCGWAARCGAFDSAESCGQVEFFDVLYPDGLLATAELHRGTGGALVDYLLLSLESGRVEFDAEAAETCLSYVEARGCDKPYTYAPSEEEIAGREACAAVFSGTMTRNGPCMLSMECAAGEFETAVCGFDPNCTDACCTGGCRVLVAGQESEPCNFTTGCAPGLFCATDPNTFQPTVCTKQRAIGQACQNGGECAAGSECDFNVGTCAPLAGAGQSCNGRSCEVGTYCADPQQIGEYRCMAYGDVGAPCVYEDGCRALNTACDYDWMTGKGQCVEMPVAGQACLQFASSCAPTATCDWNTNTCRALAGEGEQCGWIGDEFNGTYVGCAGALLCDESGAARCEAPVVGTVCAVPEPAPLPGEG